MILNVGTKGEVVGPAQATFIEPRVAQHAASGERDACCPQTFHIGTRGGGSSNVRARVHGQQWRVEGLVCDVVFSRSPAVDVDVIADDCSGSSLVFNVLFPDLKTK